MGGVSARAAVPLPLTQVRNGTGWHAVALANDFERATVELLLLSADNIPLGTDMVDFAV
jgi:hypothetical protein